jgi:Flp pilus assembly pilin Flp
MRNVFKRLALDRGGAMAAEYSLILAVVAAGLATSMVLLRAEIMTTFDVAADSIAAGRAMEIAD